MGLGVHVHSHPMLEARCLNKPILGGSVLVDLAIPSLRRFGCGALVGEIFIRVDGFEEFRDAQRRSRNVGYG